jgi:DNA-binding response OmpR family regulator
VHVRGARVHVTHKEYQIIDVFICKLRKKLVAATHGDHHIATV